MYVFHGRTRAAGLQGRRRAPSYRTKMAQNCAGSAGIWKFPCAIPFKNGKILEITKKSNENTKFALDIHAVKMYSYL